LQINLISRLAPPAVLFIIRTRAIRPKLLKFAPRYSAKF